VFTRGTDAGGAVGILRIMSKRILDIEARACLAHWQKARGSGN
jgi:hypothetical protein